MSLKEDREKIADRGARAAELKMRTCLGCQGAGKRLEGVWNDGDPTVQIVTCHICNGTGLRRRPNNMKTSLGPVGAVFECPDCGRDLADTTHAPDCPRAEDDDGIPNDAMRIESVVKTALRGSALRGSRP